jgi:diaminopimelate decarboxylase
VFFIDAPRPVGIPLGVFNADSAELEKLSVAGHAGSLTRPVMFIVEPGRNATIETGVSAVRAQLKKDGRTADYLEVEPGFALGLPQARAAAYRKIEEFINLRLYDYRVKIGPSTEVK